MPQGNFQPSRPVDPESVLQKGGTQCMNEDMSMINSIVSHAGAAAYDQDRYASKAKAMFDDDGSGNTGIEVVRLNKKFDIFLKRFARAEEDIKEVKQNFYRVMHCAFAKYEQGFKRKNEYLEKRKSKRHDEI